MKKAITLLAALALLVSCGKSTKCISPIAPSISLEDLNDAKIPAMFTNLDFDWENDSLAMAVMNEDIYDAEDIANLQVGDTIIYDGNHIVVKTILNEDKTIFINGGLEEGGAWLEQKEDGSYRASIFDDHSIYTKLGETQLPLANDLVLIDCGMNPQDPYDTICGNIKEYLDTVPSYKKEFFELNTTVTIKNGKVTEIYRKWIP